ncbi:hypothetical protein V2J09_003780 [Rumex salicifolius]
MLMMKMSFWFPVLLLFLLNLSFTVLSTSQSNYPLNLQSYYPYTHPPPPATTPPPPHVPAPSTTSKRKIIAAVGATAASTFVVAGVFFLLCSSCFGRRRQSGVDDDGQTHPFPAAVIAPGSRWEFARFGRNVKGVIVDEDGLDVLYWRRLKDGSGGFRKELFNGAGNGGNSNGIGDRRPETVPRGRSSTSHGQINPGQRSHDQSNESIELQAVAGKPPIPPPAPSEKKIVPIPPPPPVPKKKSPMPPPPPPRKPGSGESSSSKPPAGPKMPSATDDAGAEGKDQVALKPLHWEKLNVDTDHSMVWDKIQKGSFQYNGDIMEALFGVLATNRKSPKEENQTPKPGSESSKIFILDPRKSHNTAIVLKSLGIPRAELIDSLLQGKGLPLETLEKLARASPTPEEESQLLAFSGDPSTLAFADSFLFALLTAVPSAFTRANAMLFRLNYDHEILSVKESLQTLEHACGELRSRGIFLKLLEAILKAGNRLNAGTARGDAKAFNLNTLLKLSDYKSSDGKTTLLHFVVHEVVRNEGRRCVLARSAPQSDESVAREESENDFLKLGLPIVGGLSSDFSNAKKSAFIDYDSLKTTLSCLGSRVEETRKLVAKCKASGGGFLREMKDFLESSEAEMKIVKEENVRVMSLVKKTTEYYQAGASNESNPLQLFVIVKGFLAMVDQACVEIARSLQQKKKKKKKPSSATASDEGGPGSEHVLRTRVTFRRLPEHFLSDKSSGSDLEGE